LRERLISIVKSFGKPKVMVIGDLILDKYVWGEVERISPEAPIPVLRVSHSETRPGGAGCVVSNLTTYGASVTCVSVVGVDGAGKEICEKLQSVSADTTCTISDASRRTSVKTRLIGFVQSASRAAQHILRVDEEDSQPPRRKFLNTIVKFLHSNVPTQSAVLVSDYNKGLITRRLVSEVVKICNRSAVPVIVDPRKARDFSIYHGVTAITPNRYEAELATGIPTKTFEGLKSAGTRLLKLLDARFVDITIDKDGQFLCERGRKSQHFPVKPRAVYDVTGAGDMVLATLGMTVASGFSFSEAVELANVAAGIEVSKLGAATVSKSELIEALSQAGSLAEQKIRHRSEISSIADFHRAQNHIIVFTNGCFDIIHPGHIEFLQFAKSHGDVLIVGINSDRSVRSIKGEGRPILSEIERSKVLAATQAVDYIVSFDEDTPQKLVEQIRPDVLVKGEDWKEKGVVGREFVESLGGRVILAPLVPGVSTTQIIEKVKAVPAARAPRRIQRRKRDEKS
jgi:D-beta-D-heptose 7-phosphate kinase/D-beta-D-heptose 1-phosphate adenosyltransferase